MYVKQFCLILSLTFLCVALEDFDSSDDVAVTSEVKAISEDVFQLGRTCASDSDCHHLGTCVAGVGGKFCKCKAGTSGDFCEKVDECVDNPVKCGTLDDVSCVFDVEKEVAVCKCDNETKTYVEDEERCMSPCVNFNDCGQYGRCYHKIGNQKFCACFLGVSGDYCETIDACENKEVDCGMNNNAICTITAKGKAYCKCDDTTRGFDYEEKTCKDCSGCGGTDVSYGKCSYSGGIRTCSCRARYYSSEFGKCEDCKCGLSSYSYGCKFENGRKICQCTTGAALNDGICQKCYCGFGQSKCEFQDGKETCTCVDGYTVVDGTCKRMCNTTNPCENGGKCVKNVCKCLKGTSGDLCKTIDECKNWRKCGNADCNYNVTSQEAYCKCKNSQAFDEYFKFCLDCECGFAAESCTFVRGKKTCNCKDVFKDRLGKCTICTCRGKDIPNGCKFDEKGKMNCECLKGYAQTGNECKKCDCGDHGKCSLAAWGLPEKTCTCDEGYIEDDGICKECNCGKSGKCSLSYDGKKTCTCSYGYKEYQGTCKGCYCDYRADCDFDTFGNSKCTCQSGYGMKNGVCTPCNCYPGTSCTFDVSNRYMEKKFCDCPKGYADDSGNCRKCDCEAVGSNCSYSYGFMHCQCPKGFKEEDKGYSFLSKICKDIDECQNSYSCPLSSTKCVNTPGSFKCVCKDGYEGPSSSDDIKRFGCKDIDECLRDFKPCNDPDAKCVNTPGSYRCECKYGYYLKATEEKRNMCGSASRPWRTATIVVAIASIAIILGLLMAVFKKCSS